MGGEILYGSVREISATGTPLIEICNKWLFAIVSMTHSLVFPFLVPTVVNLLFYIGYIILFEVARELPRFCKIVRRSGNSCICFPGSSGGGYLSN